MKKSLKQILQENMRRFGTKNLYEYKIQPIEGRETPEWIKWNNEKHSETKPVNDRLWHIPMFLIDIMYFMGQRLIQLSGSASFMRSERSMEEHVPELKKMIQMNTQLLEYIKQKFPLYYKKLDDSQYGVINAFKQINAQLQVVINKPDAKTAQDDLADCSNLYGTYSEEAVEARNDSEIINYLNMFSGKLN